MMLSKRMIMNNLFLGDLRGSLRVGQIKIALVKKQKN